MYRVAPRRPGADVTVPRGSRAALVRYEGTMWRQTPEFGFPPNARTAGKKNKLNPESRSDPRSARRYPYPLGHSESVHRGVKTLPNASGADGELSYVGREPSVEDDEPRSLR